MEVITAHGPASPAMEGADGEADRARRLEVLRLRTRQLERQRITAGPTMNRAGLVALDVELCRVEAAKRMLAPTGSAHALDERGVAIPGAPWCEPSGSLAEQGGAPVLRDVLRERPGTIRRSDRREDRRRPSQTPRLLPR